MNSPENSLPERRRKRRKLPHMPARSLLPNAVTVMALCAGLTSIRFSFQENWKMAVLAIAVAAILDGLDGRVARLVKGATRFGAELDSLSDFLCFGAAPALLLYNWSLNSLGGVGWILVLLFAVCSALRLARFNTAMDDEDSSAGSVFFFTGIATPAAAGVVLIPLYLEFQLGDGMFRNAYLCAGLTAFVAFAMVSQIPTYSFKSLRVPRRYVMVALLAVGLTAAVAISYPWAALTAAGVLYLATLPLSVMSHRRYRRKLAAGEQAVVGSDDTK